MHIKKNQTMNRLKLLDVCANGEIDTFKEIISNPLFDYIGKVYEAIEEEGILNDIPTSVKIESLDTEMVFSLFYKKGKKERVISVQKIKNE